VLLDDCVDNSMLMSDEMDDLSALLDDCLWVAQTHANPSTYFNLFILFAVLAGVFLILVAVFACLYCRARAAVPEMKPLVPSAPEPAQAQVGAAVLSMQHQTGVRQRQTGNYVAAKWE
jgi:hypothetical protein